MMLVIKATSPKQNHWSIVHNCTRRRRNGCVSARTNACRLTMWVGVLASWPCTVWIWLLKTCRKVERSKPHTADRRLARMSRHARMSACIGTKCCEWRCETGDVHEFEKSWGSDEISSLRKATEARCLSAAASSDACGMLFIGGVPTEGGVE